MVKKIFSLAIATLLFVGVKAQKIDESIAKIGDLNIPAYSITIEKDVDLTQKALKKRLEKDAKLKSKKKNGYVAYLDQVFSEIASSAINMYTKVEKQGDNSVVTICAIPTDLTADKNIANSNVSQFLLGFAKYVEKYENFEKMEAEEENLKAAKKVQKEAVSEKEKLEKKIKSDKEKLADAQKDIKKYESKIKDCENDIKKLESDIDKNTEKQAPAEQKVKETTENVKVIEAAVEKYKKLSE